MFVGKISTKDVATAIADETICQVVRCMATRNVGMLVGIVALDDVVAFYARGAANVVRLLGTRA